MRFKVGDPVWVDCNNSIYGMFGRKEGVVVGVHPQHGYDYAVIVDGFAPKKGHFIALDRWLSPRRPPPTFEAGNWEAGVWMPKGVEAYKKQMEEYRKLIEKVEVNNAT